MRIVIDTSVLVRYLLRPSTATRRLIEELWPSESVTLVVAPELLAELEEVLQRPKIRRYVTAADAAALTDAVRAQSIMLEPLVAIPPFTRDRKDDKFIACGLRGDAQFLVTYDEDLLVLGAIGNLRIGTPEQLGRALYDTIDEEAQGLAERGAAYSAHR
jgi:putative PIN family toxin of toxin-antitoxin system